MPETVSFHNPNDWGKFEIGSSQTNQVVDFTFDTAVIPAAVVTVNDGEITLKRYTVGDGLVLSNSDMTASLTLNGTDFPNHIGRTLLAHCCFFQEGTVDSEFQLHVIQVFL